MQERVQERELKPGLELELVQVSTKLSQQLQEQPTMASLEV